MGETGASDAPRKTTATTPAVVRGDEGPDSSADLTRTISELNEARMRLDAVVRRLIESTPETARRSETVTEIEALRLRVIGKLDRIREKLVARLVAERRANVH